MGTSTTSSLQLTTKPSRKLLMLMLVLVVVGYYVVLSLGLYKHTIHRGSMVHGYTKSSTTLAASITRKTDMNRGSEISSLGSPMSPQRQNRPVKKSHVTLSSTQHSTFDSTKSTIPKRVTITAMATKRNHIKRQAQVRVAQPKRPKGASPALESKSHNQSLHLIKDYLREQNELCVEEWKGSVLPVGSKPLCDCVPKTLTGTHSVNLNPVPLQETIAKNGDVQPGGHWEPKTCSARYKVVIVIPFRDRHQHLSVLLHYLHPILKAQQINYTIVVVEQNLPKVFNKAVMMNIGYKHAIMKHNAECIIFHDVDFIPEDGRHLYRCRNRPLHLGAFYDANYYRVNYTRSFGGATAFRPSEFEKLNGFSNLYFGWGGEDDDMWMRIRDKKLGILRNPREVAGYTVLRHKRDMGNIQVNRKDMIRHLFHGRHPRTDGLNSLQYVLKDMKLYPLYTWILVNVGAEKL